MIIISCFYSSFLFYIYFVGSLSVSLLVVFSLPRCSALPSYNVCLYYLHVVENICSVDSVLQPLKCGAFLLQHRMANVAREDARLV